MMPLTPLKKTLSDLNKQIETKASMRGVPLMPEKLDELVQRRDTLLAIQESERQQRIFQSEEADRIIATVREETASGGDKTCNAVAAGTEKTCSAVAEAKDEIVGTMSKGFAMLRELFTARKPRTSSSSKMTDEEKQKVLLDKQEAAKKRKVDADERKAKKAEEKKQKEADRKAKKEEADRLKQAKAKAAQDLKDFFAKQRPAKKAKTGEQGTGEPRVETEAVESREPLSVELNDQNPANSAQPSEDVAEPPAEVKESGEQDIANAENPPAVEEASEGGDALSGRARLFNFVGLSSKS
ncbi:unnamed protein product [Symbiodinium necroappetens]|uniref:Uncharacterized protein n=1 Tax=Symbiodinium necroappetens TaxID=1628268 RepID=A0A812V1Z6_9DINO|nr:unnamed protein product [Symbiodinium necroappetens]